MGEVLETLKPEHLTTPKSRLAFECMVNLYDISRDINIDNIALLIEDRYPKSLDLKDKAIDFLMTAMETTPEHTNVPEWASTIKEAYNKKVTQQSILEVKKALESNSTTVEQAVEALGSISEKLAQDDTLPGQSAYDLCLSYLNKIQRIKDGEEQVARFPTGFPSLDRILGGGIYKGGTTVISGRPSMGKTSFAMQILLNLALQGEKVLAVSLEMTKEQLAGRTLFSLSQITEDECLSSGATEEEWEFMMAKLQSLADTKDSFFIDDSSKTPERIFGSILKYNRIHGCNIVMVDYAQNVDLQDQYNHVDLANFVKKLTMIGRDNNITILLVSQLKRELENRQNKRPLMSDHSDTKKLEEVAAHMITIYRDEIYNPETEKPGIAEVSVIKNRWGATGTAELNFIGKHTRFVDPMPSQVSASLSRSKP
jgi:replicative DNA helicase